MGRGIPLPNGGEGCPPPQRTRGSRGASCAPQRGRLRPKTNLVHFVADRTTLIAIIRIIVSAVMDVKTHAAKHEQQICDHVYIHTPYTRAFF